MAWGSRTSVQPIFIIGLKFLLRICKVDIVVYQYTVDTTNLILLKEELWLQSRFPESLLHYGKKGLERMPYGTLIFCYFNLLLMGFYI